MKKNDFAVSVLAALGLDGVSHKRTALRKIVGDVLEEHSDPLSFRELIDRSPLFGTDSNQINLSRHTVPAVRDILSSKACLGFVSQIAIDTDHYKNLEQGGDVLIHPFVAVDQFRQAIEDPNDYGVFNSKSKTGVDIGHHVDWGVTSYKDRSDNVREVIESWEYKSGDHESDEEGTVEVSLSRGIEIVDLYVHESSQRGEPTGWIEGTATVASALGWTDESARVVKSTLISRQADPDTKVEVEDINPVDFDPEVVEAVMTVFVDEGSIEEAEATPIEIDLAGPLMTSLDGLLNAATGGAIADANKLRELLTEGAQAKVKAKELEDAVSKAVMVGKGASTKVEAKPGDELPDGDVVFRKAYEVLGLRKRDSLDFEVPFFDWNTPHPMVPDVDPDYIFRPDPTLKALMGLLKGVNTYAVGHTGSGKTTLFTQLAARMQWPVIRVNFDSEITRLDLIGRDVLRSDPATGVTVSEFIEGVLPTAIAGPFILLCDEVDRVRPEVSYVFQRALEDQGILLNEDGGRLVSPHDWHRIVATANTVGQGDEFGLYQGARHQSQAFLDRFSNWIEIGYLSKKDETKLLKAKAPGIDEVAANTIMDYVAEHRAAFVNAEILQPISARGIEQLGVQYVSYKSLLSNDSKAMKMAFDSVVLVRGSATDRAVMTGLFDRVQRGGE